MKPGAAFKPMLAEAERLRVAGADEATIRGLADVTDEVLPYGSIMAGDWEADAPWRRKHAAKNETTPQ